MAKWTTSEDFVIKDCITKNPGNLDESFETASRMLVDRSKNAVKQRWYGVLRYGEHIFFIQSKAIKIPNRKNIWKASALANFRRLMLKIKP